MSASTTAPRAGRLLGVAVVAFAFWVAFLALMAATSGRRPRERAAAPVQAETRVDGAAD